ncbi:hypothetical protein ColLi_12136 [Colletotrichum liriopes]|uniref:Uncharacterized protein n=1 Tax=Colletotrichum liriopes TaxID=708192 RepID=A0AA37GXT5_9PEZI|nr:hypothetical protein ColLi_12136 [Colletotrichum liriopes]
MANFDNLEAYFEYILHRDARDEVPASLQTAFYNFIQLYDSGSTPTGSIAGASTDDHGNDRTRSSPFPPSNPFSNMMGTPTTGPWRRPPPPPPPSDLTDWGTIPSRESQISKTVIQRKATQLQTPFQEYLDTEHQRWAHYHKRIEEEAEAAANEARNSVLQRRGARTHGDSVGACSMGFTQTSDPGSASRSLSHASPPAAQVQRTPPAASSSHLPQGMPMVTPSSRTGREEMEKLWAEYDANINEYQATWERYKAAAERAVTHHMTLEEVRVKMMQLLLRMDRLNEQGIGDTEKEGRFEMIEPGRARTPAQPRTPQTPQTPKGDVAATDNNVGTGESGSKETWRFDNTPHANGGSRQSSTRRRGQGSRGKQNATIASPTSVDG